MTRSGFITRCIANADSIRNRQMWDRTRIERRTQ